MRLFLLVLRGLPSSHRSLWRTALVPQSSNDERVTNHFGSNVGFIFCEMTPKIDLFWQAVAALFSIQSTQGEIVRIAVLSAIRFPSFQGFLVLDNFEKIRREEPGSAAEAFLAELTDGTRLSLLVTFQGDIG